MARRCLGLGEYDARFIARRTATSPALPIGEARCLSGSWGRALSGTTDASVVFGLAADGPSRCADVLAKLRGWRHELELYRSGDLCWAGPVMDVLANPGQETATVTARDYSAWWSKRLVLADLIFRGVDLATIMADVLAYAFATDDPGIDVSALPTGILGDRTYAGSDAAKVSAVLEELARTGVDWTVAGRTFFVGGTEITAGRLPGRLTDEHFATPPQTRRGGAGMVNDAYVRGNGLLGHYGGPDPDGVLLQDVADENTIEDQGSADAAAKTWWERAHEPMPYLEGDNDLDPSAPLTMGELVPGLLAAVDVSGGGVVPLRQDLRLEKLSVSFDPNGEKVTVGLQPVGTTAS